MGFYVGHIFNEFRLYIGNSESNLNRHCTVLNVYQSLISPPPCHHPYESDYAATHSWSFLYVSFSSKCKACKLTTIDELVGNIWQKLNIIRSDVSRIDFVEKS